MQAAEDDLTLWTPTLRRRFILGVIAVLVLLLFIFVPPYVSLNRYQRRVAASISGAVGRPVHFDNTTLHLLPLPGLTIDNFVVSENPDFGAEPVLRANTVEARLRFASLWRRRIEVSRILLQSPSINLVRLPESGRWNLQTIVTQASQLKSAPTAQARAGDAPRFPYIEATDARVNIKSGADKLPFSLKEADFALWLPEPDEWRLRLSGRPVRTDTDVSDTGLLKLEARLGRGGMSVAQVSSAPIDLSASWKPTPLGEAAKLTVGHDANWRGEVSAEMSLHGTVGEAHLTTDLHLLTLRRADFVPEHTAELDAHCEAVTAGLLRSLHDLRCAIPTNGNASIFDAFNGTTPHQAAAPGVLRVTGDVPNLLQPHDARLHATLQGAQANYALAWLRLFSRRIPRDAALAGTLALRADFVPPAAALAASPSTGSAWTSVLVCDCTLPPAARQADTSDTPAATKKQEGWRIRLSYDPDNESVVVEGTASTTAPQDGSTREGPAEDEEALFAPAFIEGTLPLHGALTRTGASLTFDSSATARIFAGILPPLADGMPADATGALREERAWNSAPVWTTTAQPAVHTPEPRRRHHR